MYFLLELFSIDSFFIFGIPFLLAFAWGYNHETIMHIHWGKESRGGMKRGRLGSAKGCRRREKDEEEDQERSSPTRLFSASASKSIRRRCWHSVVERENSLRDRLAFEILAYFSFENPINSVIPWRYSSVLLSMTRALLYHVLIKYFHMEFFSFLCFFFFIFKLQDIEVIPRNKSIF